VLSNTKKMAAGLMADFSFLRLSHNEVFSCLERLIKMRVEPQISQKFLKKD
jgi:hypothetical protein